MHILVDGVPIAATPGQSVAAALMAAGITWFRCSPREGAPRGAFCLMGVCQECVVQIDGAVALSCQVPVRPGQLVALGCAVA